jgi:hypothetical protein
MRKMLEKADVNPQEGGGSDPEGGRVERPTTDSGEAQ